MTDIDKKVKWKTFIVKTFQEANINNINEITEELYLKFKDAELRNYITNQFMLYKGRLLNIKNEYKILTEEQFQDRDNKLKMTKEEYKEYKKQQKRNKTEQK